MYDGSYPAISEIKVAIEKKPKATAVIAENPNAKRFLYFN